MKIRNPVAGVNINNTDLKLEGGAEIEVSTVVAYRLLNKYEFLEIVNIDRGTSPDYLWRVLQNRPGPIRLFIRRIGQRISFYGKQLLNTERFICDRIGNSIKYINSTLRR